MEKLYASVRILNASNKFDREYTYFLLPEMRKNVKKGTMCTVPYGNSNKLRTGVIVGFSDECEYPQIKPVSEVFEYPVGLTEETIGLCSFMKERCFCTFGSAVRTVLPAGQEIENEVWCEALPYDNGSLNEKGAFLYERLTELGKTKETDLVLEFGEDVKLLVSSLSRLGALKLTTVSRKRVNEKKTLFYRLAETDEASFAAENPETLKSEKQRVVVSFLKDGSIISASEAEEMFGVSQSVLTSLIKAGIAEKYERREVRDYISKSEEIEYNDSPLSEDQQNAFGVISGLMESGEAKASLLYGVTGSGKTRVIIEACRKAVDMGKAAIVLVPEIGLTAQAVGIYRHAFGEKLAVIHSMLSVGEKLDACRKIRNREVDVVIGTRSAVFAPFTNLGLIVIDEEQEHTYKSENTPKYHARDIARYRCAYNKCLMLLASATPSVESFFKAKTGVYTLVRLDKRYGSSTLPKCEIVDVRGDERIDDGKIITASLAEKLNDTVKKGKQAILFVNRRGYNSHLSCLKCGHVFICPNCSVSLTYHAYGESIRKNKLVCHYCGYVLNKPDKCPECESEHIGYSGYGTQKLQDELENDFPHIRAVRMDADTTELKHSHEEIVHSFESGKYDLLFGTQMVAKGLDFPNVSLVGVVSADSSLFMNDFRAGERTFSLFTQLAGRAGRGKESGQAIFQTYTPENEILRLSMTQDYDRFYKSEISLRKAVLFPPFCDIAVFTFSAETENDVNSASVAMSGLISGLHIQKYSTLPLIKLGPYKEEIFKLRNKYRQRIILKYKDRADSRRFLSEAYDEIIRRIPKTVKADIDINPPII